MACCELVITSKGKDYKCLYDEEDGDLVQEYRWSVEKGYARANHKYMHRLILGVTDPKIQVDHIDHNTLNNHRSNLRLCNNSENQCNRHKIRGSVRFKGVNRHKGRYLARITCNNKVIYLGSFRSEITAAKAYDKACKKLHKEFGVMNFSEIEGEPLQLTFVFREPNEARKASIKLIDKAMRNDWIKQLGFYHLLKLRFINGCIYNYRSRKKELAGMFDISINTLNSYLKKLKEEGLIVDHSDNLKLKSLRDFNKRGKKCIILISYSHSLVDVVCLLYGKVIERRGKQQAFVESARRFGRGDKLNSGLCENPFHPSLSYRTIAKLINVSEYKAFNVINILNRLEVIRTLKQKPKLISRDYFDLHSVEDLPGYRFIIGKRLYKQYGNRIEFLQFPIYLPHITNDQYKRFIIRNMKKL
jgi:hypothetical protein